MPASPGSACRCLARSWAPIVLPALALTWLASAGAAAAATYEEPTRSADLVAYWPFDEGHGTVARDVAGGIDDQVSYVFTNAAFKPSSDRSGSPAAAARACSATRCCSMATRRG